MDEPQNMMLNRRNQMLKSTYHMIPLVWTSRTGKRSMYTDRKQVNSCLWWVEGPIEYKGEQRNFLEWWSALYFDCGSGYRVSKFITLSKVGLKRKKRKEATWKYTYSIYLRKYNVTTDLHVQNQHWPTHLRRGSLAVHNPQIRCFPSLKWSCHRFWS